MERTSPGIWPCNKKITQLAGLAKQRTWRGQQTIKATRLHTCQAAADHVPAACHAVPPCHHSAPISRPSTTHPAQVDPGQWHARGRVKCGHETVREVHCQAQQGAVIAGHQAGVLRGSSGVLAGMRTRWAGGRVLLRAVHAAAARTAMRPAEEACCNWDGTQATAAWNQTWHAAQCGRGQTACQARHIPTCSMSMCALSRPPTARMVSSNTCTWRSAGQGSLSNRALALAVRQTLQTRSSASARCSTPNVCDLPIYRPTHPPVHPRQKWHWLPARPPPCAAPRARPSPAWVSDTGTDATQHRRCPLTSTKRVTMAAATAALGCDDGSSTAARAQAGCQAA